MKKALSVLVAALMIFALMPAIASATSFDYILSDGETFDISTAADGDTIGVSGAATLTGTKKVRVFCSEGTTLTIDNLNIDVSATLSACPITFDGAGNTLILKNTSSLKAGYGEPAAKVLSGTSLEIKGGETDILSVQGGENAAGIGSGDQTSGGTIEITGGQVTSTGGDYGAGIGSGNAYNYEGSGSINGGTIKISGGIVEAEGGMYAAGIGGGDSAYGGNIIIKGTADVTAIGNGGAGIGGGYGRSAGSVGIQGGTVKATGVAVYDDIFEEDCGAAGIGGGIGGDGGVITITGGEITALSTEYGAGIGSGDGYPLEETSGYLLSGGVISITGGTVNATGGYTGAGIGGGYYSDSGNITISGGTINATGGESGAGIGGGYLGSGGLITISGGTVNAVSEGLGAGIGGGEEGYGGIITIYDGTVFALSEEYVKAGGDFNAQSVPQRSGSSIFEVQIDLEPEAAAGIGNGAIIKEALEGFAAARDSSGLVRIFGGVVYAGGPEGDIGPGATIEISGSSAVFLKNDLISIDPPALPDGHVHKTSSDSTDPLVFVDSTVYGITVETAWTDATGGYFRLYTLEYDANGGSGGYETEAAGDQEITLDDGTGFTNSGYVFAGWNTQSDGGGTGYNGGAKMQMPLEDITLFAVWEEDPGGQRGTISTVLTDGNGSPIPGNTIELHSVVLTKVTDSAGKVTFSNVLFVDHTLIIKDSGGTVLATFALKMSKGTASGYVINGSEIDVSYTGHTVSVQLDISFDGEEATVEDVTILDNPDTGGSPEWLIWAAITALILAVIAAAVVMKRSKV